MYGVSAHVKNGEIDKGQDTKPNLIGSLTDEGLNSFLLQVHLLIRATWKVPVNLNKLLYTFSSFIKYIY